MAIEDGLVSAWNMNNNWNDSVGPNNGVPNGPIFVAPGFLGSHRGRFDGINDYVNCGNDTSLNFTDSITMHAIVNLDQARDQGIMSKGPGNGDYTLKTHNVGQVYVTLNGSVRLASNDILTPGNIFQVIATYDRLRPTNQIRLYVQGVYVHSASYTTPINVSTSPFLIGTYGGLEFDGDIDAVYLWGRALSDGSVSLGQPAGGEISTMYNGGSYLELPSAVVSGRRRRMLS